MAASLLLRIKLRSLESVSMLIIEVWDTANILIYTSTHNQSLSWYCTSLVFFFLLDTPEKPIAVIDQLDEPQPDFIMFSVSNYNEQVEAARKPDFVVIRIIKKEKTEETEGDDATNQDGQIEPNENQWEMEKIKQIFFGQFYTGALYVSWPWSKQKVSL